MGWSSEADFGYWHIVTLAQSECFSPFGIPSHDGPPLDKTNATYLHYSSSVLRILVPHVTDKNIPLAIPPLEELPHHNGKRIDITLLNDLQYLHVLLRYVPRAVVMDPNEVS